MPAAALCLLPAGPKNSKVVALLWPAAPSCVDSVRSLTSSLTSRQPTPRTLLLLLLPRGWGREATDRRRGTLTAPKW
jgi:hypothetical protein